MPYPGWSLVELDWHAHHAAAYLQRARADFAEDVTAAVGGIMSKEGARVLTQHTKALRGATP
jgi:hypothetical protein